MAISPAKIVMTVALVLLPGAPLKSASPSAGQIMAPRSAVRRSYREGESIGYTMQGLNQGHLQTRRYQAQATGVVRKDVAGVFFEDLGWSDLSLNGAAFGLSPASTAFRERLSLDPDFRLALPDLSKVQPALIGPITDLLTFYADVQLAVRQTGLQRTGDHVYVKHGTPNSWADGRYTLLGQDSVDFDILLQSIDSQAHTVTLRVCHVPPAQPRIPLPAEWMRDPVGKSKNNWIEVEKTGDGKFAAEIGEENFEALILIDQASGRILHATLENPVEVLERDCEDAELHSCGPPVRYRIYREIKVASLGTEAGSIKSPAP